MKKKLRILLVSPFFPGIGGISVSSERLCTKLISEDHIVGRYRTNKSSFLGRLFSMLYFPLFVLFSRRYDVVHFHLSGVIRKVWVSLFVFLYKGAKTIVTLHGDISSLLKSELLVSRLHKFDYIICTHPGDANRLPLTLKSRSCDLPAYISPVFSSSSKLPLHVRDFIKNNNKKIILYYGAWLGVDNDIYGISDAVDILTALDETSDFALVFLLTCPQVSLMKSRHFEITCNKVKSFRNALFIPDSTVEMAELFPYAHIYLRTTITDGDSLAIREAMAAGCYVVASNSTVRPVGVQIYNTNQKAVELINKLLRVEDRNECLKIDDSYHKLENIYYEINRF